MEEPSSQFENVCKSETYSKQQERIETVDDVRE